MTRGQFWIIAILAFANAISLVKASTELATWPDHATVQVPPDKAKLYVDVARNPDHYAVEVPLKEFPYDVQLQQYRRFDYFWLSSVNLLLLGALIYSYWRKPATNT